MGLARIRTVLLDTNALFLPFTTKISLERELDRLLGAYRLMVPRSVLAELRGLAAGERPNAGAALKLAQRYEVVGTDVGRDASLMELALDMEALVLTADNELARTLRQRGITVVYPRGKGKLEIAGDDM